MKRFIYIITISIAILACKKETKVDSINKIEVDPKLNRVENIFEIIGDLSLFQIAKNQSQNESVDHIKKIVKNKKTYLLLSWTEKLYLIDHLGNILAKIDNKGFAPGQYRSLNDIAFNENTNEFYAHDKDKQQFLIYDVELNYLRNELVGYNFKNFIFYENNLVLYTSNLKNYINDSLFNYNILVVDSEYDLIYSGLEFEPVPDGTELFTLNTIRPLQKHQNFVFFNDLFVDSIYSITTENVTLFGGFNYSNKTLNNELKAKSHKNILEALTAKDMQLSKTIDWGATLQAITKNLLLYSYSSENIGHISIKSLQNHKKYKTYKFPDFKDDAINRLHMSMFTILDEDDHYLYSLIYPLVLEHIIDSWKKYNNIESDEFTQQMDAILKNTEPDGNQILLRFKLNQF